MQISDRETQVWASTQKPHDLRTALADYIDLDESRLRVATPDVGGGFGPKLCVYPEDVAVVAAATLLRRSVKWIEDRREHFTNAAQERDQYLVDRDCRRSRRPRPRRTGADWSTISAPMRCRT